MPKKTWQKNSVCRFDRYYADECYCSYRFCRKQ